jgi:hypothetical protein
MAERIARAPIVVPREVFDGLDCVRRSGLTSMFDVAVVAFLARRFGFEESAAWVEKNRAPYVRGVVGSFRVEPEAEAT